MGVILINTFIPSKFSLKNEEYNKSLVLLCRMRTNYEPPTLCWDIVLVTNCLGEVQTRIQDLQVASKRMGLSSNISNTMVMTNLVAKQQLKNRTSILVSNVLAMRFAWAETTNQVTSRFGLTRTTLESYILRSDIPVCLKGAVFEKVFPTLKAILGLKVNPNKTHFQENQSCTESLRESNGGTVSERQGSQQSDTIERIANHKCDWAGHSTRVIDDRWTRKVILETVWRFILKQMKTSHTQTISSISIPSRWAQFGTSGDRIYYGKLVQQRTNLYSIYRTQIVA